MPISSFFSKKIDITYDQTEVLRNMEAYLRKKGDEASDPIEKKNRYELADRIKTTDGFCHGFALYFLDAFVKEKNSKDPDSNFLGEHFANLKKISAWNRKDQISDDLEIIFEKVIAGVNWMQDPRPYHSSLNQSDVEKIMEGEFIRDRSYYNLFKDSKEFADFLITHVIADRPILISSSNHATALYYYENKFYCRDPNDPLGLRVVPFNDAQDVAEYFFNQLKQLYPQTDPFYLPINFNVYRTTNQKPCELETYQEYLVREKKITEKGKVIDREFFQRVDPSGRNALWLAVYNGDAKVVKLLLDCGADPNVFRGKDKFSVFEYSMYIKSFEIAELIAASPKFNTNFIGFMECSPLMQAITSEQIKIVNLLLRPEKNPDVNYISPQGETALHLATKKNNALLIKKLLEAGADILTKKEGGQSVFETVLEKCLDPSKKKSEKLKDITTFETLLKKSPNTSEIRQTCFDALLKNKSLFAEANADVAYMLMDKHAGSDLAIILDDFLAVPKLEKKTSWTSMFKKQPIENDHLFEEKLRQKLASSTEDIDSAQVLQNIVLNLMADFAKNNIRFSENFNMRINFIMKYLEYRTLLELVQPKEITYPSPVGSS